MSLSNKQAAFVSETFPDGSKTVMNGNSRQYDVKRVQPLSYERAVELISSQKWDDSNIVLQAFGSRFYIPCRLTSVKFLTRKKVVRIGWKRGLKHYGKYELKPGVEPYYFYEILESVS